MTSVTPSNIEALALRTQCVFENGIAEPGDDFRLEYLKRLKDQFPNEQIVAKTANPLPEEIKKICGQLIENANANFERSTFLAEAIKLVPQNTPPQFRTIFNEIIDTSASQTRSLPSYYWRDLLSVRPDFAKNLRAHKRVEANSPKPILLKPTPCSNSVEWEKHELKIGHYRIPVFLPLNKTYPWAMFEEYLESGFVFLQAVLSPEEFSNLLSPGKNRPDLSLFLMSPVAKAEEAFNNCGIRTDDRDGQYDSSKHAISLLFKQPTTFHAWSSKDTKGKPENFLQHFSAWPFEVFLHEIGHAYASVYFNQDAQFKTVMSRYFDWLWEQTIPDEKERGEVKPIVTSRSWDKEWLAKLEAAHTVPDYKIYLPESPLPDKTSPYALHTPSELLAQLFQEYFLTRINRLSPDLAEKKDAHFKARYRLMATYFENPARLNSNVWSLKTIQQIFKDEGIELGFIKPETEKLSPSKSHQISAALDLTPRGLGPSLLADKFIVPGFLRLGLQFSFHAGSGSTVYSKDLNDLETYSLAPSLGRTSADGSQYSLLTGGTLSVKHFWDFNLHAVGTFDLPAPSRYFQPNLFWGLGWSTQSYQKKLVGKGPVEDPYRPTTIPIENRSITTDLSTENTLQNFFSTIAGLKFESHTWDSFYASLSIYAQILMGGGGEAVIPGTMFTLTIPLGEDSEATAKERGN